MHSERANKTKRLKVHQAARQWRRDSVLAQHIIRKGLIMMRGLPKSLDRKCLTQMDQPHDEHVLHLNIPRIITTLAMANRAEQLSHRCPTIRSHKFLRRGIRIYRVESGSDNSILYTGRNQHVHGFGRAGLVGPSRRPRFLELRTSW